MLNVSNVTNRYSDEDLAVFKNQIEQKLEISFQQLKFLLDRIENISESTGNDGDWMDDSSNAQDTEMLHAMVGRQRKHIRDLENALIRIQNKRYGICIVTGQLIDKRRLMAVLTTTKSLEAKNFIPGKVEREETERKRQSTAKAPASFSKVIKRTGGTLVIKPKVEDDFFGDDDDDDDDDLDSTIDEINLEEIVDESTED
jgi:RNA polymerase-binding transcription factor DksA